MIYYSMYILFGILSFSSYIKMGKKTRNILQLYVPMVMFILLAGLRAETVGTDTANYARLFQNITWNDVIGNTNFVYELYSFLIKQIFHSNIVFNILNAVIINYSIMKFIEKYSTDYMISYWVILGTGVFFNSMNQCREYMAIAFLLWATDSILENKIKKFLIFSLLAIFTHNISVIMVIALFGLKFVKTIKIKYIIPIFVGLLIIYRNYDSIIDLFVNLFPRYQIYMQEWVGLYTGGYSISRLIYIGVLCAIEIIALFSYQKQENKEVRVNQEEFYFALINMINIVVQILVFKVSLLLRVAMLFDIVIFVLLPSIITKYFRNKLLINGILYICMGVFMTILLRSDGSGVMPYRLCL